MKHYTLNRAVKEIGDSTDEKLAKKVSIKKWKEIIRYGIRYYKSDAGCGYCIIKRNKDGHCSECPVVSICLTVSRDMTKSEAREVLKAIRRLK